MELRNDSSLKDIKTLLSPTAKSVTGPPITMPVMILMWRRGFWTLLVIIIYYVVESHYYDHFPFLMLAAHSSRKKTRVGQGHLFHWAH